MDGKIRSPASFNATLANQNKVFCHHLGGIVTHMLLITASSTYNIIDNKIVTYLHKNYHHRM